MSHFAPILGETLLCKTGQVSTEQALSGKKVVALYCSAHWCPPCQALTQKLAEWYCKDLRGQGLEVVFLSWDACPGDFEGYYSEMPWLALPYTSRDTRDWLSDKYKVKSFPKLILLGPSAELITLDGCSAITNDPTGRLMPWKPPTCEEVLSEAKLVTPEGGSKPGGTLQGQVFGLLFGAFWHSECRGFVQQLAEWYEKDLKHKGFEVVFVSSDRSEAAFKKFSREQPWPALDFQDRMRKEQLNNLFGNPRLPTLVIIGDDGSVINRFGHSAVSTDPAGADFPWRPPAVVDLSRTPEKIREVPTVVALCEGSARQREAEELLRPVGEEYLRQAKAECSGMPRIAFAVAAEESEVAVDIRAAVGLPETPSAGVRLVLVDAPDCNSWYRGPEGELTAPLLEKFLADYFSGALARQESSSPSSSSSPKSSGADDCDGGGDGASASSSTRLPDDCTLGSIRALASSDSAGQLDDDVPARRGSSGLAVAVASAALLIAGLASVWYVRQEPRRDL